MRKFLFFIFSFLILGIFSQPICPSGYKKTNDKCLKLHTKSLKHLEAEHECSQFGGTLATIKNAVDNRAIYTLAASAGVKSIWIGLFCYANRNSTMCFHDDNSGPMIYKNFPLGDPDLHGNNGCVFMWTSSGQTSAQWGTSSCGVVGMPFVCEAPFTLPDPTCTHNYNGYCYLPSHELKLFKNVTSNSTYSEATAICASFNATLASIHSKPEVDYIHALFKNSGAQGLILGALPADGFYWNDGSNWDYSNVNPLDKSNESCLLMDLAMKPNYGLWSKTDCHSRNHFLCKRRISQEAVPEKAKRSSDNERRPVSGQL
ncbi:hypothetical protein B9Z55_018372 [Caenorhabditis nigoni]|uniref:C-type lectin domain-containing protein n=1 Tax=Caenorhabditis nigoni TaxID=1611254 RepID=A0A2G5TDW5_9PELO|nr:hypothetical protein B9Z55_018372 [Caenorhabditis nigoni]